MRADCSAIHRAAPLLLLVLLAACSSAPGPRLVSPSDGAPGRDVDVSAIPDAVPRLEPLSRYGNPPSYEVGGRRYYVRNSSQGYAERGIASWYGTKFHGRRTSSGEPYDVYAMTAAHKDLPLPTFARVTNLQNGRSIVVRINDRGPFHDNRIIDLSYVAAKKLGILPEGTGLVEVRALDPRQPEPRPPVRLADTSHSQIYLQVGAFAERRNADRLASRLSDSVTPQVRVRIAQREQHTIYRVQMGPLGGVDEADRLSVQLGSMGLEAPHVVVE
jgi:rare lipoprotein A